MGKILLEIVHSQNQQIYQYHNHERHHHRHDMHHHRYQYQEELQQLQVPPSNQDHHWSILSFFKIDNKTKLSHLRFFCISRKSITKHINDQLGRRVCVEEKCAKYL